MRLRDLSLKTKLLAANTLMVVIPITVLVLIGAALLGGLRHAGTLQQEVLALLWPEKGNALTVQFAMSSLRTESERKKFKLDKVKGDIRLLEGAGVRLLVVQTGENYLTQGANPEEIRRMVTLKCGTRGAGLTWDREGLFFRFEGLHNGAIIMGAGAVPMTGVAEEPLLPRDMRDFILNAALVLLIGAASIGILLLGRYLARLLSEQILAPLAALRAAAAAIRQGDLSHALPPMGSDEVGATCRAFDDMRQDLARARAREAAEEERRRELFIGILHDITTPLTAIKGYASGILDGIARTPEKQRAYAERISTSAATMERLTSRLREFLRLGSDQLPLAWETVDAHNVLATILAEHAADYKEQGLFLSVEDTDSPTYIRIDRTEFARVLKNLWENSSKYRRGEREQVHITLAAEGDRLAIRCDDDGVGVQTEELPRLFDSFYRTDAARTNVAAGSGLGLAIVRQIMTAFGGGVRAESSPIGGLRIVLLLPIVRKGQRDAE